MIHKNYFPPINDGHTMKMEGQIDPERLYVSEVIYEWDNLILYPCFDDPLPDGFFFGVYMVFSANDIVDFHVITSKN